MKRLVTLLVTALLMTAALCVSASAADYQSAAEDLSAIGMFRGTVNGGFELDRAPKRSEAAIMLVRLYGAEEEAAAAYQSGEISHPFKDVGPIASPYVAWLYTKGITKGATATTFNSNAACTDKNYVVFLLRALGYEDGKDFQYAESLTFAEKLGFYQADYFDGPFLRDDLAAITLQALATDKKGGETYLLKSLIDTGAVDAKKAAALTGKIEAYRTLAKASITLNTSSVDALTTAEISGNVKYDGTSESMSIRSESRQKVILSNDKVQISSETTVNQDGISSKEGLWVKDGWAYYYSWDNESGVVKVKTPYDDSMTLEDIQELDTRGLGLSSIQSISVQKSGSNTVYSLLVDYYAIFSVTGALDDLVSDNDLDSYAVSDILVTYTLNSQGAIISSTTEFSVELTYKYPNSADTLTMELDYVITTDVKATGASVTISYPDFSEFVTVY